MDNNRSSSTYLSECCHTIEKIWKDNSALTELRWFLEGVNKRSAEGLGKPEIVVLGTGVPEELIYGAGAVPCWLIGGSQASAAWSDDLVPRDTDPVSRSILGFIHQSSGADFSGSLFIIPLVSDSMRKIAYDLKTEGRRLCLVDVPPDRNDPHALEDLTGQLMSMTGAVSEHMGIRVTKRSLLAGVRRVSGARAALRRFLEVSRGRSDIITDPARLFIRNSYYMTGDIAEWTAHLQQLTAKIELLSGRPGSLPRPAVLLMGSPVIFPNFKIPSLIRDAGLSVLETADQAALKTHISYGSRSLQGSRDAVIRAVAEKWSRYDASPAYVKNDALYQYVRWLVSGGGIEGVVYHVLKGQIEYDFELERFERLFAGFGIPVFRLETDYQYQDVEQLRIRLEAFSEMLVQNRCQEVKAL